MEELRAWWADLPEERQQEIRDTKIPSTPPKPKKPKKDCGKKKEKEPEPEKKPDPPPPPQPEAKPDLASVLEMRAWAIADM